MILLISMAWMKLEAEPPQRPVSQGISQAVWRRSRDGWEDRRQWNKPLLSTPTLHPAYVAALQLMASLAGLLAFESAARSKS